MEQEAGPWPVPMPSYPVASLSKGGDLQGTMIKSTSSGRATEVRCTKNDGHMVKTEASDFPGMKVYKWCE